MDFPSPGFLVEALNAGRSWPLWVYEKDPSLYEAIIWWMSDQHGVDITHEMISLLPRW